MCNPYQLQLLSLHCTWIRRALEDEFYSISLAHRCSQAPSTWWINLYPLNKLAIGFFNINPQDSNLEILAQLFERRLGLTQD